MRKRTDNAVLLRSLPGIIGLLAALWLYGGCSEPRNAGPTRAAAENAPLPLHVAASSDARPRLASR